MKFSLREKLRKIPFAVLEFLLVLLVVVLFMLWLLFSYPTVYWQTLPEFIAGALGIVMGFAVSHWFEYWRELGRTRQVLRFIKEELNYNNEMINKVAEEIVGGTFIRSPFKLFKTHIWTTFNEDLRVMQNAKLVSDLGELYHELSSINEAMKTEPVDETFFPQYKKGWKRISQDIQELIERIDKELKIKKEKT